MSIEALFTAGAPGLPRTVRGDVPYFVEALSPREVWGHGHGSTSLVCGQTWSDSAKWLRLMLGEWEVRSRSAPGGKVYPQFVRLIPEKLRYPEGALLGTDARVQWCTGLTQTEQGGNPEEDDGSYIPGDSINPFTDGVTNWPATAWCKYQAQFETTPYVIRTDSEIADMLAGWDAAIILDDPEFLRYVVRQKTVYNREQPIPAATNAGGFKLVVDPDTTPTGRNSVGVAFKTIMLADVTYRWVNHPLNWPPPPGWSPSRAAVPNKIWPPRVNPVAKTDYARPLRDQYIGTTNTHYFDFIDPEGYAFEPETLLYTGYQTEDFYNASGQRTQNTTFKFKYKEGGWNKVLDAFGVWREVSADVVKGDGLAGTKSGRRMYEKKTFQDMFKYLESP